MEISPEEKVRLSLELLKSDGWALICSELDKKMAYLNTDISFVIRKKDFEKASRLEGNKEMVLFVKNLPLRIKRENEGIVQRIKNLLAISG